MCPDDPNLPYDMTEVVKKVVDEGNLFEVRVWGPTKTRVSVFGDGEGRLRLIMGSAEGVTVCEDTCV